MKKERRFMKERIKDKIKQIEEFIGTLSEIKPLTFEDYINDLKTKAACERYAQKIIEAIIDLTYLVIKERKWRLPEGDEQAFDILIKNKILSLELGKKLQDAKGMRNFLIHQYGEVDDEIIFNAINEELEKDIAEFLNKIEENLKKEELK